MLNQEPHPISDENPDVALPADQPSIPQMVQTLEVSAEEANMEQPFRVCPYLGSQQDLATAHSYVTVENCCNHVRPVVAVKLRHQQVYCLTYHYAKCKIFRSPDEIVLKPKGFNRLRRTKLVLPTVILCLMLLLAAVVLASLTW